ncbi:MAG: DUF488 domain-containing protein [Cytophagales bacterium]|nr:DUF488 domain-containing protein [Cytophagales bacterium]
MYYRRKILLALLEKMGGKLLPTDMQKLLFLFCERQREKNYEFVPYRFGGFSFQSYADKRTLTKYGYLSDVDGWELTDKGRNFSSTLKNEDQTALQQVAARYGKMRGNPLVKEVYRNYPYYAIYSEILEKVLSQEEIKKVEAQRPKENSEAFFTIGYEGISQERYLNKLIKNNVKLLCDVRKNPLSMKYGFSKNQLKDACEHVGIQYLHIPDLGIVPEKRKELNTKEDYERLFEEYERTTLREEKESLDRLLTLLKQYKRIAITCFEACETQCHRGKVAKTLQKMPEWKYPVKHL